MAYLFLVPVVIGALILEKYREAKAKKRADEYMRRYNEQYQKNLEAAGGVWWRAEKPNVDMSDWKG